MKKSVIMFMGALGVALSLGAAERIASLEPVQQTAKWATDWWMPRFKTVKEAAAKGDCEVVFLGDSITHNWDNWVAKSVWNKYFAKGRYKAINAGFGGDRTEHVLWRLDHGQLDGCKAKAIVLMIGTNNTGHREVGAEPPIDTILGIRAVLDKIAEKQPQARVILLPIFPRGETVDDPCRKRNDVINKEIVKFADGKRVIWLDFTDKFLTPDGRLPRELAPDFLHPRAAGYEIWANEVIPVIDEIFAGKEYIPARYARVNPAAFSSIQNECMMPQSRLSDCWWLDRIRNNRNMVARSNGVIDAVFLGDSITHYWDEGEGLDKSTDITEMRKTYSILNGGYGGDDTRHLLWRLKYGGELDGFKTKFVMLMIGTNNAGRYYPDKTCEAIQEIIRVIQEKQPEARILHMAIIPRGQFPTKNRLCHRGNVLNGLLKMYDEDWHGTDRVTWLDINDKFIRPNGELKAELFDFEFLHPIDGGFKIWRAAIEPYMKAWIGK